MGRRVAALVASAAALFGMLVVLTAPTAAAADGSSSDLTVTVRINDRDVSGQTVALTPDEPLELTITAENPGTEARSVRLIRVSGVALALRFFAYDTTLPFQVPARGRVTRTFPLDVRDLDGQAVGLLPTSIELLTEDRTVLGSAETVADVRGSLWSVYGVFGLAMLGLTAFAWAGALLALARHKLSANRFRRALRFLPAGVGTGLVAVVSLSVLRMVPPAPAVEIPVVIGAAIIAMVLGFLTPHPSPEVAADRDDETMRTDYDPAGPTNQAGYGPDGTTVRGYPGDGGQTVSLSSLMDGNQDPTRVTR